MYRFNNYCKTACVLLWILFFNIELQAQGTSLHFDGVNDYVTVPTKNVEIKGSFTVMAWVKPEHATKAMHIFSSREPAEFGFDMQLTGGNKVHGDIGNGTSFLTTSADANYSYAVGKWLHVAYVITPTAYKIYVNGNLMVTSSLSGTPLLLNNTHRIVIGKNASETTYFQGNIDEVKVFSSALNDLELVAEMMNSSVAAPASLVAHYDFNQSATTLTDLSGNSYDGTLTNFALTGATSNWVESYAMVIPNSALPSNISSSGFTLNWQAPTNGVAEQYVLEVATNSSFNNPIAGSPFTVTGTSQNISGLLSGTDYYYRISAQKNTGIAQKGAYSAVTKVTTALAFDYLNTLSISNINISPVFSATQFTYTAITANADFQLLAAQPNSSSIIEMKLNGGSFTALTSGVLSPTIPLNLGINTLEVKVTDGASNRTYTLSINRVNPTTRYVTQNGAGNKDGSSWANASDDLQLMINNSSTYDMVWVAKGTYIPKRKANDINNITANDRNNAFLLKADVEVYGGLAGTENSLSERDLSITANRSILTGDFNQDDVVSGKGLSLLILNNSENAYHVVLSVGPVGIAKLDGFTVRGGNANGNAFSQLSVNGITIFHANGGGINSSQSSPKLSNLRVLGNSTSFGGGGIANYGNSSPIIENVLVTQNRATGVNASSLGGGIASYNNSFPQLNNVVIDGNTGYSGGGMCNKGGSHAILTNVIITDNHALQVFNEGGGIYNEESSPILTNVLLANNTGIDGGAIYNGYTSVPVLTNVTITKNTADNGAGIYHYSNSSSKIRNSIIWGNNNGIGDPGATTVEYSLVQGGFLGTGNIAADPQFKDSNGNYQLRSGSPAIDAGSTSYYGNAELPNISTITKDLGGNKRVLGVGIDMGAYEIQELVAALNFDGVDDKITFNSSNTVSGAFTVQAWVRPTDFTKTMHVLSTKFAGGYGFDLQLKQGNTIHANIGSANAWLSNTADVTYDYSAGRWMHIAYAVSATGYQIYVNGSLKQSGAFSGTPLLMDANHLLQLGFSGTENTYFKGDMDEVRIYNKALSAEEINKEMMNATTTLPLNLETHYNFDEGASALNNASKTILEDQGANARNGVLSGFDLNGSNSNWVESYAMVLPSAAVPISLSSSSFEARWGYPQLGIVDNGYVLEVATDAEFTTPVAGSPFMVAGQTKTITGLAANATYYYRVAADKQSVTEQGAFSPAIAVTLQTFSPPGNALNFDGGDDHVVMQPQATVVKGNFTVMAWVKPEHATKAMHIFSTREGGDNTFDMQLTGGNKIHGDIGKGTAWMTNTADANYSYTINRWLHVAYVVSPSGYKIYANGKEVGNGTLTDEAVLLDATHYITIGKNASENTYFKGSIDEVKIYSAALTAAEIKVDMLNSISNLTALVAYYNFDQASNSQSDVLTNQGNNAYHGSLKYFELQGNASNWIESYAQVVPQTTAAVGITDKQFRATWAAPAVGVVENYVLEVATDNAFTQPIVGSPFTVNALYKDITGLTALTNYYYRVKAEKASVTGQGALSEIVTATTLEPVLPVVLTTYTAKIEGNYAKLLWQTASEQNNKGFEIYRSGDDKQFVKLDDVSAKGIGSSYTHYDKAPLKGNNYYRLVQVDLDGKPTELGERVLNFALSVSGVQLYPNPTKGKVMLSFSTGKYTKLTVTSVEGKILDVIALKTKDDGLEIDLTSYPVGVYFVKLTGISESVTKKVIKQ
ncbi:LamG-like jellyroll fold domain-containing protein [Pedobacter sp.]|uniref:LamG-like jellyroll fold domain-containing protein n=1 Tax=Pedobacter sp. TaxID=1411316 RepID=UPI0031E0B760